MRAVAIAAKKAEPVLVVASAAEWHDWLATHHASSTGVLLRIAKKGGQKTITYAAALEVALAWGWIDSQKLPFDDSSWIQRFTPRTKRSSWSRINCATAEALIAAGTMEPPGLVEVERAKHDGRWERAYDGGRTSEVPPDLAAALARNVRARLFFETLDRANRYAILYRVQTARKPDTRADRIARFVAMCARHEVFHPSRRTTKDKGRPRTKNQGQRTKDPVT